MESNKKGLYTFIAVVTMIVSQIIFRTIGMDNISAQIFVSLLIIANFIIIIATIKNKNKGLGLKYNLTISILTMLASIFISIMIILIKCYPNLYDKYGLISTIFSLVSFFALIFYIIIYRIIYEVKSNKTH